MSKIGDNTVKVVAHDITKILENNKMDLNSAFQKMGDSKLEVAIKVKFDASKGKGVAYEVKMSFPSGAKVEDFAEGVVDDPQINLEFKSGEKVTNIA